MKDSNIDCEDLVQMVAQKGRPSASGTHRGTALGYVV